jgi:formate/nitrite transporter FocA (FNT family)
MVDSGALAEKAAAVATSKVSMTFMAAMCKAILCNMLVVLACLLQAGANNMVGKLFAIFFPIMLFVLSGYEHSIANMFFIPLGQFAGASITTGTSG